MTIFETCQLVNDLIRDGKEPDARTVLIKLLSHIKTEGLEYSPLVNRLIRAVGLFPYLDTATASWEERFIYEAFKADIGTGQSITLHREQSRLLNALLTGKSIAVSAPTSFGKSFVIDSFISIKKPKTIVILVPTIALADETRRRLQRKFGLEYKIITTPDQTLGDKSILVFPQERVFGYLKQLSSIEILIVDEFYKASQAFDKERSPALIRAIVQLGNMAKQRYFLAPNISELAETGLTREVEFMRLDFSTVYLEKDDLYKDIGKDERKKSEVLLRILGSNEGKTLIYAGTYSNIRKLSNLLIDSLPSIDRRLLNDFGSWLANNYEANWELTRLVLKGVGIHNGQLHRSLSQIQIRLFEEEAGIDRLVSTSSIIEGVNTSAQNVILWSNKNGNAKINDFTYKNIIGRGGRMFRHFVGKVFVLEEPPKEATAQLSLDLPDELLGTIEEESFQFELTAEQLEAIHAFNQELGALVGAENLAILKKGDSLQGSNKKLILRIAKSICEEPNIWNGLSYINSANPEDWERILYQLIRLRPEAWEVEWNKYVAFIKVLSGNWYKSIPELLEELSEFDIGIDEFFKLERITTYKLAPLLSDLQTIYNQVSPKKVDLTPAISRLSNAFLPPVVFQLEEFGIPRMISRKIARSQIVDLVGGKADIHQVISAFQNIGLNRLLLAVKDLENFDNYIISYFYEGISYDF